jgi:Protein of unknown function (DUF2628)
MIDDKYLVVYFDRQRDYYLERYRSYHLGDKFTFNIGAFFGGVLWFIYRKLFLEATIIVLLLIAYGILESLIYDLFSINSEFQKLSYIISSVVFAIVYGFIGNQRYFKCVEKRINNILLKTMDENERIRLLKKKGGVLWTPILIIAILIIALIVIGLIEI